MKGFEDFNFRRCPEHFTRLLLNSDTCQRCDDKMSERRRIVTLLSLDLLLRDKKTSEEWLNRAIQLIEGGHDG